MATKNKKFPVLSRVKEVFTGDTYQQISAGQQIELNANKINKENASQINTYLANNGIIDPATDLMYDPTKDPEGRDGFSKLFETDTERNSIHGAVALSIVNNNPIITQTLTDKGLENRNIKSIKPMIVDGKVTGYNLLVEGEAKNILRPKTWNASTASDDQTITIPKASLRTAMNFEIAKISNLERGRGMRANNVGQNLSAEQAKLEELKRNLINDQQDIIDSSMSPGEKTESVMNLNNIWEQVIEKRTEEDNNALNDIANDADTTGGVNDPAEDAAQTETPTEPAEEVPTSEGVPLAEDSVLLTARKGGYGVKDNARTQKDLTAVGKEFPDYIAPKKEEIPFSIPQDQWNNLKEADRRFITKRSEQLTKQNITEATKAARITFDGQASTSYAGPGNTTETTPSPSFLTQLSEQEGVSPEEYKEAEKTVDHFKTNKKDIEKYVKENPEALKQYTDSPVSFISAHRKGELPGQKNDGTATTPSTSQSSVGATTPDVVQGAGSTTPDVVQGAGATPPAPGDADIIPGSTVPSGDGLTAQDGNTNETILDIKSELKIPFPPGGFTDVEGLGTWFEENKEKLKELNGQAYRMTYQFLQDNEINVLQDLKQLELNGEIGSMYGTAFSIANTIALQSAPEGGPQYQNVVAQTLQNMGMKPQTFSAGLKSNVDIANSVRKSRAEVAKVRTDTAKSRLDLRNAQLDEIKKIEEIKGKKLDNISKDEKIGFDRASENRAIGADERAKLTFQDNTVDTIVKSVDDAIFGKTSTDGKNLLSKGIWGGDGNDKKRNMRNLSREFNVNWVGLAGSTKFKAGLNANEQVEVKYLAQGKYYNAERYMLGSLFIQSGSQPQGWYDKISDFFQNDSTVWTPETVMNRVRWRDDGGGKKEYFLVNADGYAETDTSLKSYGVWKAFGTEASYMRRLFEMHAGELDKDKFNKGVVKTKK